jgi:hypothetical protein
MVHIRDIRRDQLSTMCMRRRCDHQVEASRRGLSASPMCRSGKFAVTSSDRRVDGQRLEVAQDRTQAGHPLRSSLIIGGDQNTELQLRDGYDTDRQVPLKWRQV